MQTNLMAQSDTRQFRKTLETEAEKLRGTLRNREGATIESVAEECERTALAGQRELSIELVDRASRRLRDVEFALQRIEEGVFGVCLDCDEPIPVHRLAAIPWASRCVRCQEIVDSGTEFSATAQGTQIAASWLSRNRRFGPPRTPAQVGESR